MSDLKWTEAKNFFDPDWAGQLPDIVVPDTTVADWQVLFDLVRSTGWPWEYQIDDNSVPLPSAAEVLARPVDADYAHLQVWPATDVLVIFRAYTADQIDFDLQLRELHGQQGMDLLCDLLRTIGRGLGKPVLMYAEGANSEPLLGFLPVADRVTLLSDPRLPEDRRVLTEQEARRLAENKLAALNVDDRLAVVDVKEVSVGWVYFTDSVRQQDAPLLVDRETGNVLVTGTAHPVEDYLAEYTAARDHRI